MDSTLLERREFQGITRERFPVLSVLDVSYNGSHIDDDLVRDILANNSEIRTLFIAGSAAGDKCIHAITSSKSLQTIVVNNTKISSMGMKMLKDSAPHIHVLSKE